MGNVLTDLRLAATTHRNDDISIVGTELRRRFARRNLAMINAADEIERLQALVEFYEKGGKSMDVLKNELGIEEPKNND